MSFISELKKRRTFAIISHPDAGKTTLTEKLLLFGGAIQTAGAVKSNKIKKTATSDFMEIEKQRGISVATSVMTFEYGGRKINIFFLKKIRKKIARYLKIGFDFLARNGYKVLYVSNPTWGNHNLMAKTSGFAVKSYRYYSAATKSLDFEGLIQDLEVNLLD